VFSSIEELSDKLEAANYIADLSWSNTEGWKNRRASRQNVWCPYLATFDASAKRHCICKNRCGVNNSRETRVGQHRCKLCGE
jgi:hypothetical protein